MEFRYRGKIKKSVVGNVSGKSSKLSLPSLKSVPISLLASSSLSSLTTPKQQNAETTDMSLFFFLFSTLIFECAEENRVFHKAGKHLSGRWAPCRGGLKSFTTLSSLMSYLRENDKTQRPKRFHLPAAGPSSHLCCRKKGLLPAAGVRPGTGLLNKGGRFRVLQISKS